MKKNQILFILLAISHLCVTGQPTLQLTYIGQYTNNQNAGAEIVCYDSASKRAFVTNGATNAIDILDVSNPSNPTFISQINLSNYGGGVNSVANIGNGYIVAAVQNAVVTNNGKVVFFDTNGNYVGQVTVGALPDMVKVSPDKNYVLTANEGEPSNNIDPIGSVSIINISGGVSNVTQSNVQTVDFSSLTSTDAGTIIFPNRPIANDLEPEYIAISPNSQTAVVTLQENNALAIIDIPSATLTSVKGLGFKDHNVLNQGLDASDKSSGINIRPWQVKGAYQPDAIVSYEVGGNVYYVTANEGDARDDFESRVKDLTLDPTAFPNAAAWQDDDSLGRLKVLDNLGDTDNDGDYDELYSYGGRSFSIWDANGNLIFDSGDAFAQKTAQLYPSYFNSEGTAATFKGRSDDKGIEPEAVDVGEINGRFYAFIGLERIGGVFVYDVTDPQAPYFLDYANVTFENTGVNDIAPEAVVFVPAAQSPISSPILLVSNEVSGSTSVYRVDISTRTTGVSKATGLKVFPNPSQDGIFHFNQTTDVLLFNAVGELLLCVEKADCINLSSFPSGVYFLKNEAGVTVQIVK